MIAAELQILLQPARLHAARAASASMARPDAVAACARLVADVLRRRTAILDEPEPRPPSAATAAGPLEEVGVDPEEYRRIAAERRSLQLLREQAKQEAKQEIDDRLAALKSRMKPQP